MNAIPLQSSITEAADEDMQNVHNIFITTLILVHVQVLSKYPTI